MSVNVTTTEAYLAASMGSGYFPLSHYNYGSTRHRPIFDYRWLEEMLETPTIQKGLKAIAGPIIAKSQFEIKVHKNPNGDKSTDKEEDFKQVVQKHVNRFFSMMGNSSLMDALEWGFCQHEMIIEKNKHGSFQLEDFTRYKPIDCIPHVRGKKFVGFKVKNGGGQNNIEVGLPKAFHFAHERRHHHIFGRSVLFGSFRPWIEEWNVGGTRDIKKLWFAKNCYQSGILYFPHGVQKDPITGIQEDNAIVANRIAQQIMTGAVVCIKTDPGTSIEADTGGKGTARVKWFYVPGTTQPVPEGIFTSLSSNKDEQLEGMGVVPEVIQSGGEGFGSATGRAIPVEIFYTTLQACLNDFVWSIRKYYLDPILQMNNVDVPDYDIQAYPLGQETMLDENGDPVEEADAATAAAKAGEANEARKVQNTPAVKKVRDANQKKANAKKKVNAN